MDFGMFCLSYGFADVIRRPLMVALVIASLSIAGFYAYQNVVLEFYYSWPYAQMGADVFVSANIEEADDAGGDLFQKLEDSGALVTDYRVVIEHEGVAEDIVLHAIAGRSLPFADATVFNYESMHSDLTEGSVWVDSACCGAARILGRTNFTAIPRRCLPVCNDFSPGVASVCEQRCFADSGSRIRIRILSHFFGCDCEKTIRSFL